MAENSTFAGMGEERKLRVILLFSGAGGLDLGLRQAGLEVVWANGVAEDAVEGI